MTKKFVCIDFEYNQSSEPLLNLVCASLSFPQEDNRVEEYWLYNQDKKVLKNRILALRDEGYYFVAFNVIAEGQSFIALNVNPVKCQWIDLQIEYKMLLNHWDKFQYGKQLIRGKEVRTERPNRWAMTEEESFNISHSKPEKSLSACTYKLLGIKIDTDHKNKMRDIIIANDPKVIEYNRADIIKYCTSDTLFLFNLWEKIKEAYISKAHKFSESYIFEVTMSEVLWRGESAARTAMIMSYGYPVDIQKTRNFSESIPALNKELCEDINSQFSEDLFRWNNKDQRYSKKIKEWKDIIKKSEYAPKWLKTDKGDFSCSLDAFENHFSFRHDFPKGNFFAQVMRYLKIQRSLNGFLPKGKSAKDKEDFFSFVGQDSRVRVWLNPYGAQSARFQPKATGFIPLKSAWMRSLIVPASGRACCGVDYSSQEFLIAALVSKDENMMKAYESGDVYLYFAKLAGAVPWEGKKEDYKKERDLFKATTLGISYSMGANALALKLSDDIGREVPVEEAQELINKFAEAYPKYAQWVEDIRYNYYNIYKHIKLPDGWIMFGDNDNKRSVSNVYIQGLGSSILRKAIAIAQDKGLEVIFPLHDALYIEYPQDDLSKVDTLIESMSLAFGYYFEGEIKEKAKLIRLDASAWSSDYGDSTAMTPKGNKIKKQNIYIDPRSIEEYEKFKKYL